MKPIQTYEDWKARVDEQEESWIDENKHIHAFEEVAHLFLEAEGDPVVRYTEKIKYATERQKKMGEVSQKKMKAGTHAGQKSAAFKEKASKTKNPITAKIASSRADEESMKQQIYNIESKTAMMKQKLAQAEAKTAEMKKKAASTKTTMA